ncbi:hypothetical protein BDV98DRAFT_570507 [Pterulicium gracile]|uniref:Uncharacterized protein n=1 Tax=Pterulicium gracile TaxID=1884261 RepID=A0A5C3QHK7_9AGAR|nr:hypothetical protein BDV98DRAFT_570507 [Pterula gracilis]
MSPNNFNLRPITGPATLSPPGSVVSSLGSHSPPSATRAHPPPSHSGPHEPPRSSRRSYSPSSLRDLDLSPSTDIGPRRYPPPPTGHQLMAMFPPAPPDVYPEMMRAGSNAGFSTSDFFRNQERAFFAKSGKEVIRMSLEVRTMDVDSEGPSSVRMKKRPRAPSTASFPRPSYPQPHPSTGGLPPSRPPSQTNVLPNSSAGTAPLEPRSMPPPPPVAITPSHPTHMPPPSGHHAHPHSQHGPGVRRSPKHHVKPEHPYASESYRQDDDEAWRTPMPHHERRRAGKHTRRVLKAGP